MAVKDERIKVTNEVFSGVKIIKLYAWERSFEEKIRRVRDRELRLLRQYMMTNIGKCVGGFMPSEGGGWMEEGGSGLCMMTNIGKWVGRRFLSCSSSS